MRTLGRGGGQGGARERPRKAPRPPATHVAWRLGRPRHVTPRDGLRTVPQCFSGVAHARAGPRGPGSAPSSSTRSASSGIGAARRGSRSGCSGRGRRGRSEFPRSQSTRPTCASRSPSVRRRRGERGGGGDHRRGWGGREGALHGENRAKGVENGAEACGSQRQASSGRARGCTCERGVRPRTEQEGVPASVGDHHVADAAAVGVLLRDGLDGGLQDRGLQPCQRGGEADDEGVHGHDGGVDAAELLVAAEGTEEADPNDGEADKQKEKVPPRDAALRKSRVGSRPGSDGAAGGGAHQDAAVLAV